MFLQGMFAHVFKATIIHIRAFFARGPDSCPIFATTEPTFSQDTGFLVLKMEAACYCIIYARPPNYMAEYPGRQ